MVIKIFSYYLILLCFTTVVASEMCYIIRPSPSQPQNCVEQCSNAACMDIDLTLSQFISNSSNYLNNDTRLMFSPGNYILESKLVIENVHSFSMLTLPSSSSKIVITCGPAGRFEFRNVGSVVLSWLDFVGCYENHIISVGHFQLENSGFFGNGQRIINGTVLSIDESTANVDRTMFISAVDARAPQVLLDIENCETSAISTIDRAIGITLKSSSIGITQSWFEGNNAGLIGGVIYDEFGSNITIVNTTFVNNGADDSYVCKCYSFLNDSFCYLYHTGSNAIVYANSHGSTVEIHDSKFVHNEGVVILGKNCSMFITHTTFMNNVHSGARVAATVSLYNANLVISHSTFTNNTNDAALIDSASGGMTTHIDHSKFINNTGLLVLWLQALSISVTQSEFFDNTESWLISLDGVMITVHLNEFIHNRVDIAVVFIQYPVTAENLTNNVFIDNNAVYEIVVIPNCRPGFSLSLGSSRCIQCSKNWHQDLIGIVIVAFIAGIALVVFILALNMTVAVGTLNGILFYANIVAANAGTYFLPFETPDFVSVFISWLNLDIGFDICFYDEPSFYLDIFYKTLLQLAFPAYVIILVITVIVASECSSKFAKIIGTGNPVAVLATMILISYAKLFNVLVTSVSLLYLKPAYGSRKIDVTKLSYGSALQIVEEGNDSEIQAQVYSTIIIFILMFLLVFICTALVFSWQWFLQYQDKAIFKWVRYQKLRHFLEPYHAPYTPKHRYWTGLLLFVRVLLYLISVLNFSLDPRVNLIAVILVVGGLILLKGVISKRVYKNWPLDVMETAIYFNLVVFSILTWYNLDFGGNQFAVAYTSVMIILILLLGVTVLHVLRYTRLYKYSFVKKGFMWTSSKLLEKKPKEQPPNDIPEELDGYQLERPAAGDQELPTITYSVVEISQPAQNQEERYTAS